MKQKKYSNDEMIKFLNVEWENYFTSLELKIEKRLSLPKRNSRIAIAFNFTFSTLVIS